MGTIVKDMPPLPSEKQKGDDLAAGTTAAAAGESTVESRHGNNISAAAATTPSVAVPPETRSVATLSSPWEYDAMQSHCTTCRGDFHPLNRRHHCRLCGKIFCHRCSDQRALIPPSSIVLTPDSGKKTSPRSEDRQASFTPDPDPDRMLTYLDEHQQLLYGKGLEERFQLAREPLRVCGRCWEQLQPIQEELRNSNSNAMRFNHIDPTDPKRFLNSPLAFTLGHEVRKAAYTLNNLLPSPKRMGSIIDTDNFLTGEARELQQCQDDCQTISPNLVNLDGVQIPAQLLEKAKGVAVLTVVKGGFGLAGVEFGTGLVVARLGDHQWSAPCAIGTAGVSWGALIGAQVSDHVFLLMNDDAVEMMFTNNGNIQLGADVGVAVGPLGRALEADVGAAPGKMAPIYTYSLSKGLYAGISLDGKVIMTRNWVNEKFYGREVSGMELLSGQIPTPPAARPLYDALQRCHVYATGNIPNLRQMTINQHGGGGGGGRGQAQQLTPSFPLSSQQQIQNPSALYPTATMMLDPEMEYGEIPQDQLSNLPPSHDQQSYTGMSDITGDPWY